MSFEGDLVRRLEGILTEAKDGAAYGLFLSAEHVLGESNAHVPIEESTLQRSGRATVDDDALQAAVSYSTPYAVTQHEDLTMEHDPGRTAKYLENAMNTQRSVCQDIVAQQVRARLRT